MCWYPHLAQVCSSFIVTVLCSSMAEINAKKLILLPSYFADMSFIFIVSVSSEFVTGFTFLVYFFSADSNVLFNSLSSIGGLLVLFHLSISACAVVASIPTFSNRLIAYLNALLFLSPAPRLPFAISSNLLSPPYSVLKPHFFRCIRKFVISISVTLVVVLIIS